MKNRYTCDFVYQHLLVCDRRYQESATLYSNIDGISFEEVALKFLEVDELDALKLYLNRV